jgi:hypothetical protein
MPPPDENTAVDPTGAAWVVWLVIRSRTSDGVAVVALADLTVQVRDVEPGTAYVPPVQAARLAEDTVARAVEQLEVESLVDDLEARLTGGAA